MAVMIGDGWEVMHCLRVDWHTIPSRIMDWFAVTCIAITWQIACNITIKHHSTVLNTIKYSMV